MCTLPKLRVRFLEWTVLVPLLIHYRRISTGFKVQSLSYSSVEVVHKYDNFENPDADCGIVKANENRTCTIRLVAPKDMFPPILVHYQIENFHQNHRKYIKSFDPYQVRPFV